MYNKKKYSKTLYFSGHTTELAKWNITNSASRCLTYTWTKHLCAEYETNLGRIVMHICGGSAEQLFILFITKKQIRLFFFYGTMWSGKPRWSQKEHQLREAIKGVNYIIKKQKFRSE